MDVIDAPGFGTTGVGAIIGVLPGRLGLLPLGRLGLLPLGRLGLVLPGKRGGLLPGRLGLFPGTCGGLLPGTLGLLGLVCAERTESAATQVAMMPKNFIRFILSPFLI